jgi:methionyl-tRNA formyltransferase
MATAEGLRIVAFNVFPPAYELVAGWAARRGHHIVLLVTMPVRGGRYGQGYGDLVERAPPDQDILVTTRLRRTAAPVIGALAPDLIVSATFPRRIPPEVTTIPRYGAVNLHPAPLPRGRGPSPQRLIYEGDPQLGATLHRIEPEFDAGAILSRQVRPRSDDLMPEDILAIWGELLMTALDTGVARAVAGDPGEPQDEALASYAAPFSEAETWLAWDEPASTVQRRATALNLVGPTARALIDGDAYLIWNVRARAINGGDVPPGTVLSHAGEQLIIRVADGAVECLARPWTPTGE